ELLLQLDDNLLGRLLEHCLSGVSSNDPERASCCTTLLMSLCRGENAMRDGQLQRFKQQLGKQNLKLLGDKAFINLGHEILAEMPTSNKLDMEDNAYQGVWIQRLITDPRFAATLPLDKWPVLIERYRALSILLSKDKYDSYTQALSGKIDPCYQP